MKIIVKCIPLKNSYNHIIIKKNDEIHIYINKKTIAFAGTNVIEIENRK